MENLEEEEERNVECFSFCEALKEKYCSDKLDDDLGNVQISGRRAIVQQQQYHHKRLSLALDGCQINHSGEDGDIENTCPLIQDLDLSNNKLKEWRQVLNITCQLKNLSFVNLSHNPLECSLVMDECDKSTYPPLEKLVLNNTKIEFLTVCKLLKLFPRVNELHISLNEFRELPDTEHHQQFESIKSLHFSKNGICAWDHIEKLGKLFPSLKVLIICENPISKISDNAARYFSSLEKLSIRRTLITDWDSLDQLRNFPSLFDVRLIGIPVLEKFNNEKQRRQLLMARLPNIKLLNGSKLEESDREDAERAFIRFYMKKSNKPTRYDELIAVHGHVPELADVNMDKKEHVLVTLYGDIEKPALLKLDISQNTIDFRKDIAKRYKLSISKFRLIYFDKGSPCGAEEMRISTRQLHRYHMKDGDEIELQRLDILDN